MTTVTIRYCLHKRPFCFSFSFIHNHGETFTNSLYPICISALLLCMFWQVLNLARLALKNKMETRNKTLQLGFFFSYKKHDGREGGITVNPSIASLPTSFSCFLPKPNHVPGPPRPNFASGSPPSGLADAWTTKWMKDNWESEKNLLNKKKIKPWEPGKNLERKISHLNVCMESKVNH